MLVRHAWVALLLSRAAVRLSSLSSSDGTYKHPPLNMVEKMSPMLMSEMNAVNWKVIDVCSRQNAAAISTVDAYIGPCSIITPFGSPVLPEVNKIKATVVGDS